MCVFAFGDGAAMQALPGAEADSRCVLVSAAGTPTRHLYVCVCLHGAAMLQGLAGLGFAFSDTRLSVAVAEEEGSGWARSHLHW